MADIADFQVSVIMPALNEQENIGLAIANTLKAFRDYNIKGEIIVVNDGSTDDTGKIASNFMENEEGIRIIGHKSPQGIGASFWDGVEYASGDVVVMLPGDNENDPREILRYFRLLEHVDIVTPFIFNKEVRPFFRNVLSFVYRVIINTTFMVNFNYTNGTVLYRRSLLKELDYRSNGFFFQTDILIRVVKRGYLFAEAPYRLGMRNSGVSKAVSFPALIMVIKGYFRLIRDFYFKKNANRKGFASDSVSAKRYK